MNNFVRRFLAAASGAQVTYDWDVAFQWAAQLQQQLQSGVGTLWKVLGILLGAVVSPGVGGLFGIFDARLVAENVVTLLMAYAHITTDLTQALREEGCGTLADFQAIVPILQGCEQRHVTASVQLVHAVALRFGLPMANAIQDWRDMAYAQVCQCR
jgi:hypothetical protein